MEDWDNLCPVYLWTEINLRHFLFVPITDLYITNVQDNLNIKTRSMTTNAFHLLMFTLLCPYAKSLLRNSHLARCITGITGPWVQKLSIKNKVKCVFNYALCRKAWANFQGSVGKDGDYRLPITRVVFSYNSTILQVWIDLRQNSRNYSFRVVILVVIYISYLIFIFWLKSKHFCWSLHLMKNVFCFRIGINLWEIKINCRSLSSETERALENLESPLLKSNINFFSISRDA